MPSANELSFSESDSDEGEDDNDHNLQLHSQSPGGEGISDEIDGEQEEGTNVDVDAAAALVENPTSGMLREMMVKDTAGLLGLNDSVSFFFGIWMKKLPRHKPRAKKRTQKESTSVCVHRKMLRNQWYLKLPSPQKLNLKILITSEDQNEKGFRDR